MKTLGALVQLALGAAFGVVLARNGAADFDAMLRMFLFEDAHLFLLAIATTASSSAGLFCLLHSPWGEGVRAMSRSVHRGSLPGGLIFGVGWGLSGSCPGTVLVQIGTGHLVAVLTLSGILLGNWLFERFVSGRFGLSRTACS